MVTLNLGITNNEIMKEVKGDLLKMFEEGEFDVILHGCNCFQTVGAGIAKQIKDKYPEAYWADKGSNTSPEQRLGEFTWAETDEGLIFNLYTQFQPGANFSIMALQRAVEAFKRDMKDNTDVRIGIPWIGCGIGGGKWSQVKEHLKIWFDGWNVTAVEYDNPRDKVMEVPDHIKGQPVHPSKAFKRQPGSSYYPLKIDFPALREQKDGLLLASSVCDEMKEPSAVDAIQGILSLVDAIQDFAVANGIAKEEDVFHIDADQQTLDV